jgi:hypothetical protein
VLNRAGGPYSVMMNELILFHTGVNSIALPNYDEILLKKKAEVKFAWKNYVIQQNSIKNLFT